jgi:hypothetical protein
MGFILFSVTSSKTASFGFESRQPSWEFEEVCLNLFCGASRN